MTLFPRPRIPFLIALALAIPTYGVALVVFYVAFKRPYDSTSASAILAEAKRSLETRRAGQLFRVNSGAIERVFSKFSHGSGAQGFGIGAPGIRWGVLAHPMLNGGKPFSLRVDRSGKTIQIEACDGVAWWLLTDKLWLGRRGTAPGIPERFIIKADQSYEGCTTENPEDCAFGLLVLELVHLDGETQISPFVYERLCEFMERHELACEFYENDAGMRTWLCLDKSEFFVRVRNEKDEPDGPSRYVMTAEKLKAKAVA